MTDPSIGEEYELQRFERRNSPDGLLLRYCRGRSRTFWARQILTLVASSSLIIMESWQIGLIVLLLNLFGDAFDCLLLTGFAREYQNAPVPPKVYAIVALSGLVQSLAIAASIVIVWASSSTEGMEFFVSAFLTGAVINAGLIRTFHRTTADLKVAVLVGAWVGVMTYAFMIAPDIAKWRDAHAFYIIATLMLGYAAISFLQYVGKGFRKNVAIEHDLLRNQRALEMSRAALHQREAQARRLAVVAENANDCILICTPEGKIEWVNDTFVRITGYSFADVLGRTPADVLNAPGTDPAAIAEIMASRKDRRRCRVELMNATKDGGVVWMDVSITPIFNPDGSHAMTIQVEREVTLAKQREADLARANAEAHEAALAKSRFLATMSHEIRTPMNGVIGMADLLSATPLNAEQHGYLAAITESGQALLGVINDILDLSKLQSGQMTVDQTPFDLVATLHAVTTLLRPLAIAKGISIALDAPPVSALWVIGDAGRIRQILLNLAGNAVKFTHAGGVTISLQTALAQGRAALVMRVADTGIGIAPDRLDLVFDSFAQADSAITREFGGTGLGLTISRVLARAMGGDVSVQSTPGVGSVFALALELPLTDAPQIARLPLLQAHLPDLADKRVLIAEDNRTNRLILRKMLESPGVILIEVENGALAVDEYLRAPPHLIIMDMQMPIMDGLTAIRRIRAVEAAQNLPRCPVIVLTANAFSEDAAACFDADADDFLTKPIIRAALLDCVSAQLRGKAAQAPLTIARRLA